MNPLVRDRDVDFLIDEVLDVASLLRLPYFRDHDRETIALFLTSARRIAREVLQDMGFALNSRWSLGSYVR